MPKPPRLVRPNKEQVRWMLDDDEFRGVLQKHNLKLTPSGSIVIR